MRWDFLKGKKLPFNADSTQNVVYHHRGQAMKILVAIPFILSIGLCQHHHGLLGDIPAKIHMEIFGLRSKTPYTFPQTPSVPYTTSLLHYPVHYDYQNSFLQNYTATKIPIATDLFAPAIVKTPAATKGQIEAYMKALKEEAQEELKEQLMQKGNMVQSQRYLLDVEPKAVSYVNVKLGGTQNIKYHYQSK